MKKLKIYYLIAREWIMDKIHGDVYDQFLIGVTGLVLIILLSLLLF